MNTGKSGTIYRAVITERYEHTDGREPSEHVYAHGPYDSKRAAKGAVTRESHGPRRWGNGSTRVRTGRVEQSAVIWIPAE
jgi:hypothetical protein